MIEGLPEVKITYARCDGVTASPLTAPLVEAAAESGVPSYVHDTYRSEVRSKHAFKHDPSREPVVLLDLLTGGFGGIGWIFQITAVFGVFWAAVTKLFDVEFYEMAIMFLIYVIGPIAVGMVAAIILLSIF